ncbi:Hypothetical predicted protein, partial [Olea europaea subsp. europaea]
MEVELELVDLKWEESTDQCFANVHVYVIELYGTSIQFSYELIACSSNVALLKGEFSVSQ